MVRNYETLRDTLGQNVRRIRLERKLSQEKLAFASDIDRTYVSQIERGTINPSLLVLCKVAAALTVDVVVLLKDA